jgi:hypothetical protein
MGKHTYNYTPGRQSCKVYEDAPRPGAIMIPDAAGRFSQPAGSALVYPDRAEIVQLTPDGQDALTGPAVYRVGKAPTGAIYVGRGSAWGNPYRMRSEADRERVCDQFARYALDRLRFEPEWLDPLISRSLVCHCAPRRCHADWLIKAASMIGEMYHEWEGAE